MGREPNRGDGETGGVVERLSGDAAFELLANETRLAVLRALHDADGPLSFSDLHDRVEMRDSGQFNYHLDKLLDAFVTKGEAGYELTPAGSRVVGAIHAGRYTKAIDAEPVPIDGECSLCGGPLQCSFGDGLTRIACEACGRNVVSLQAPPGAFEEYPREEWPFVAEQWTRRKFETVRAGFCPDCFGPARSKVVRNPADLADAFAVGARHTCRRCGQGIVANVEACAVAHPAVVAFHHDHGVDLAETPIWELDWAVEPSADVVAEDPIRVEVPVDLDGDRLVLALDETATVVGTRRD